MGSYNLLGDEDWSQYYKRVAEIEQLAESDPQAAREQYELLLQDYPSMIEQMQGEKTAGRALLSEGFDVAAANRGPTQNPFAYDTINYGGHIANAGKMYFGNKMANEAQEGIDTQRAQQLEEKIKLAQAQAELLRRRKSGGGPGFY
jgi:hypothetical protein